MLSLHTHEEENPISEMGNLILPGFCSYPFVLLKWGIAVLSHSFCLGAQVANGHFYLY